MSKYETIIACRILVYNRLSGENYIDFCRDIKKKNFKKIEKMIKGESELE